LEDDFSLVSIVTEQKKLGSRPGQNSNDGNVPKTIPTGLDRWLPSENEMPKEDMLLEHVHGYRGHDTKSTVHYTKTGKVA